MKELVFFLLGFLLSGAVVSAFYQKQIDKMHEAVKEILNESRVTLSSDDGSCVNTIER